MHSDMIGKIEKARRYAQEPERVKFDQFRAVFYGGNNEHIIALEDDHWVCDCGFFQNHKTCAHVMALQRMLKPMLNEAANQPESAHEVGR